MKISTYIATLSSSRPNGSLKIGLTLISSRHLTYCQYSLFSIVPKYILTCRRLVGNIMRHFFK